MDAQYFIDKFEAIPEEKWCIDMLDDGAGRNCANGHCGVKAMRLFFFGKALGNYIDHTMESTHLQKVFSKLELHYYEGNVVEDDIYGPKYSAKAAAVNNGGVIEYQQDSPKQRILAALRDIQNLEAQQKAVDETKELLTKSIEVELICQ